MENEHKILRAVYAAKEDAKKADDFIRAYIPFIKKEASKCISRICTEQDDEFSIAMIAFHEAILGYEKGRGAFLSYASLVIKSRIADYQRKEARHMGNVSIYLESGDDDNRTILDHIPDKKDHYSENHDLEATKQEIAELSGVMASFGVSFTDATDNCPKQERTMEAVSSVIRFAAANADVLEELLKTKKLPINALCEGTGVQRKTIERHRKYILTMMLVYTNGYEIIRGHIRHVLTGRREMTK